MDTARLEKLDMIRERTGATYSEADEALTAANDDVVKAILEIERKEHQNVDSNSNSALKEEFWVKGNELVDKAKELIKKGNVTKINVKSEDGETLVEIPVTIGVLGTVIAPYVAILGGLAALITRCKIEIIRNNPAVKTETSLYNVEDPDDEIVN